MKVGLSQFQTRFVERAKEKIPAVEVQSVIDSVTLTPGLPPQQAFAQVALAIATAAQAGGVPALAAISQDVARSLVSPADELSLAQALESGFESRFVASPPELESAWQGVQKVTGSSFPPPQVVNSPLVYAQADTRNLFLGKEALATDLKEPEVLTFTLGHEEGHRQARDMAANQGLESFAQSAAGDPKLQRLAFQVMREGRHANERRADQAGAHAAAQLGCEPGPILTFLLSIPEDNEHPGGLERARAVRQTMAEAGVSLSDSDWRKLVLHDPRNDERFADLGRFHADPASWQALHMDRLPELQEERVSYLEQGHQAGSLVVIDQFFQPTGVPFTHGQSVVATARASGFQGPILEMDTTFSLNEATVGRLDKIAAAQARFLEKENPAEVREALREVSVLKRTYALERSSENLEQLQRAGLKDSAVNLSLGHNSADDTRRLLAKTMASEAGDADQAGKVLLQVLRGFCEDWSSFVSDDPSVAGRERARVASRLAAFFQETISDPRWLQARQRYDRAVEKLESQGNSVVVAAGNEGEVKSFLQAWCLDNLPELPEGFEDNDLSNSAVTVVGALQGAAVASYSSRDREVDFYADGTAALGEVQEGTSFAAPRVALRLAEIHAKNPGLASYQAEARLQDLKEAPAL